VVEAVVAVAAATPETRAGVAAALMLVKVAALRQETVVRLLVGVAETMPQPLLPQQTPQERL
tara:strand:+ start:1305 stop:1490 length:186 start_codon:yes stop_codon:yes gene_type:complete